MLEWGGSRASPYLMWVLRIHLSPFPMCFSGCVICTSLQKQNQGQPGLGETLRLPVQASHFTDQQNEGVQQGTEPTGADFRPACGKRAQTHTAGTLDSHSDSSISPYILSVILAWRQSNNLFRRVTENYVSSRISIRKRERGTLPSSSQAKFPNQFPDPL